MLQLLKIAFHEIEFQGHFMKQKVLSWNSFILLSKFHCVCCSSIKDGFTEKRYLLKFNRIKLYLLLIKLKQKKSKRPTCIWMKPWLKNRNDKSTCVNIFSELLLTEKLRHYLPMNALSYYRAYVDFLYWAFIHLILLSNRQMLDPRTSRGRPLPSAPGRLLKILFDHPGDVLIWRPGDVLKWHPGDILIWRSRDVPGRLIRDVTRTFLGRPLEDLQMLKLGCLKFFLTFLSELIRLTKSI